MWSMQQLAQAAKAALLEKASGTLVCGLSMIELLALALDHAAFFTKYEHQTIFSDVVHNSPAIQGREASRFGAPVVAFIAICRENRNNSYYFEPTFRDYLRYINNPTGNWWDDPYL